MKRLGLYCVLAAVTAAIACVPSREPPAPPPPVRVPPPPQPMPQPPPPAAEWRDVALTPGSWAYRSEPDGSVAAFGPPRAEARFSIRCDRSRRAILLSRGGETGGRAMVLRTTFGARNLPLSANAGAMPTVSARVPASDPLLDQLAFSRGRFAVETAGLPTLYIPAWPEPARVIEDCRGQAPGS